MEQVKLEHIISMTKGKKAQNVIDSKQEKARRYIQIEDLRSSSKLQYTTDTNGVFVSKNDICIAWDGANAGTVGYGLEGFIGSTIAKISITYENIYPAYVGQFLKSKFTILNKKTTGATIPHLDRSVINNFLLPLPDICKQQEIVNQIEQIEFLYAKRKEQIDLLDALVKSRFVKMFGTFPQNEKNWQTGKIKDVVSEVRYGTSRPAVEDGAYQYLRMNNITYGGELDLEDIKQIDIPENELPKCTVKRGDVLFNRTNSKELVGKTCVYDKDEMMVLAGFIIRVRVNEKVLPEFLSAFLNTDFSKKMILGMCKAAIGQANINAKELQNIGIYIPPLHTQERFVNFKKQADKSKFEIKKQLDEIHTLKAALLQKYFG